MIKEITIKFDTELKPTQVSWKSQLYMVESRFDELLLLCSGEIRIWF